MVRIVLIRALVTSVETFIAVVISAGILLEWDTAALIAALGAAGAAGLEVVREWLGHIKSKYDHEYEQEYGGYEADTAGDG